MRALVATALALLVAVHGDAAYGEPSTPQISPRHGQREDAQRLREQLRELDRDTLPAPVAAPFQPRSDVDDAVGRGSPAAPDRPLLQRWWFWAALGAAAVAVAVTYEASRGPAPQLPGVTCNAAGCQP